MARRKAEEHSRACDILGKLSGAGAGTACHTGGGDQGQITKGHIGPTKESRHTTKIIHAADHGGGRQAGRPAN